MNNPYPDSWWSAVGTLVYKLPRWHYSKPIWDNCDITERLGAVKLRSDGRWSWWRFETKHFPDWKAGQGVALSKTGAQSRVYEGLSAMGKPTERAHQAKIHKYVKDGKTLGVVVDTHTKVFPWTRYSIASEPTWKRGSGRATILEDALTQMVKGWT